MPNKTKLRHALLATRKALANQVRGNMDMAIGKQLLQWFDSHPTRTVGVYSPIRNEPNLQLIYPDLIARGMHLALPVVTSKNAPLQFLKWAPGDALTQDSMGILVPSVRFEVQPDVVLVPCVGVNTAMIRLGYGGGFYDRTLATTPRPFAIGIAYDCAYATFEAAPHDVALDMIITESAIKSSA